MAKRVLIVDDDPAQRRILEELIRRFGFRRLLLVNGALDRVLEPSPRRNFFVGLEVGFRTRS